MYRHKKKSQVWNHFHMVATKEKELAKCRICKQPISIKGGSTSNLRRHLLMKHSVSFPVSYLKRPRPKQPPSDSANVQSSVPKNTGVSMDWNSSNVVYPRLASPISPGKSFTIAPCIVSCTSVVPTSTDSSPVAPTAIRSTQIPIKQESNITIDDFDEAYKPGMANVQFSTEITPSDPQEQSVLLVGQKCYLDFLDYESVKPKIGTRVTEELYEKALNLVKGNVESVPLYLKYATLARLPNVCSRHNTPSQAHTLAKLVKAHMGGRDGFIVVACDYRDILASACAIARCFPLYSRKQRDSSFTVTVHFIVMSPCKEKRRIMGDDVDCLVAAAMGVRLSARIVDMPCSEMNTDAFIQEICKVGDMLNIKPVIIKGEELVSKGFGGIYSVGKAAEHQPALVVLSHVMPEAIETIAWVGKGIVFDTGGLFIKARNSMPGMKRDCGGAAAILGAFYCAVTMGFKENLHAVFCLAENAVGPKSTRPDDVIKMYSGKTVEITNTDAEGRLVLGDGVAYAKRNLRATTILDMATLTGAQGTANGRYHAALLTNSETWERRTVNAGRLSGDLVHPVVYTPEIHLSEFNSTVADMKNSVTDTSNTPVACAGLFIGSHIDFEPDWIHIDMSKPSHFADRATGYGVALLPTLFGSFSDNRLLQYLGLIVNET